MSEGLKKIIDYIDDNYRYGSKISGKTIVDLMKKYCIPQEEKIKVYNELDSLSIYIVNDVIDDFEDIATSLFDEQDFEDLDSVLEDDEFKTEFAQLKDVVDKKYNLQYVAEYQSISEDKEQRREALNNIVKANEKLVWKLALRYKHYSTVAFDENDMFQAGMQGLLKAVEKFDLTKDNAFSTYAIWWIRQSIIRAIIDGSTTIRVPVHMHEQIQRYVYFLNKFLEKNNRVATEKEVAEEFNVSEEKVKDWERYKLCTNITSLDMPIGEDKDSTVVEFIEDREQKSPEKCVEEVALKEEVAKLIKKKLTEREAHILDSRFGFSDNKAHTLEEIGESEHITRERVRQIEAKALKKLSTERNKERLRDFYYD